MLHFLYEAQRARRVFIKHDLARNAFTWQGRHARPSAITETALLTIEGAQLAGCLIDVRDEEERS